MESAASNIDSIIEIVLDKEGSCNEVGVMEAAAA